MIRPVQAPGVKGDLWKAFKQQRVRHQPQRRMETEGGMAPNTQAVRASTSAGLASEALLPPICRARLAEIGLPIGGEDRQHMLVDAVSFHFTD